MDKNFIKMFGAGVLVLGIVVAGIITIYSTNKPKVSLQDDQIQVEVAKPVSTYVSTNAAISFDFAVPMYVSEQMYTANDNGHIRISTSPIDPESDSAVRGLQITFRKPEIEGKGGACPPKGYTKVTLFSQKIDTCKSIASTRFEYVKNKKSGVEYAFYILGNESAPLTVDEYQLYYNILTGQAKLL